MQKGGVQEGEPVIFLAGFGSHFVVVFWLLAPHFVVIFFVVFAGFECETKTRSYSTQIQLQDKKFLKNYLLFLEEEN